MAKKRKKVGKASAAGQNIDGSVSYTFLDIDGVLAPFGGDPPPRPANEDCSEFFAPFDPDCLNRLAQLVSRTNTTLVLSSSWRASPSAIDAIRERFRDFGSPLAEQTIALTTDLKRHEPRQWEILRWLEANRLVDSCWCALDDEDLIDGAENRQRRELFVNRAVLVQSEVGFNDDNLERALQILNSQHA